MFRKNLDNLPKPSLSIVIFIPGHFPRHVERISMALPVFKVSQVFLVRDWCHDVNHFLSLRRNIRGIGQ